MRAAELRQAQSDRRHAIFRVHQAVFYSAIRQTTARARRRPIYMPTAETDDVYRPDRSRRAVWAELVFCRLPFHFSEEHTVGIQEAAGILSFKLH